MALIYDETATKKTANLSINDSLLAKARLLNINLSATLEQALLEVVRSRERELWLAENQDAFAAYSAYVDEHGVFSDELRRF